MVTITENDHDKKNGDDMRDDTRDDTRTRIHEKSRIERSRNDFARERNREIERDLGKVEKEKGKKGEQHRFRWSKIWHM